MIKKTGETAAYRRVASRLKRLFTDGMVVEGTLAEVRSGSAVHYQLTRKVKGRTQTDYVPRALRDFIRPFRDLLNPFLVGLLPDGKRVEERCACSTITLSWAVVIGFIEHLHLRNQMDMARNSRALSQTVFECSGQRYDPDDPRLRTVCSQTWHNWLCAVVDICCGNGLEYVLVFKEGSSPNVYRQVHGTMAKRDQTFAMMRKAEDGTDQCVGRGEWIDASEAQYDSGNPLCGRIVAEG